MDIIIVGCGKVGQTLTEQLNDEGNNITVIDTNPEKVRAISARYDVMGVVGNGATHRVQQEAGIDRAELLIAVTGSDELNLLCCLAAKKAGNCKTIARVRDPEYSADASFLKNELGLAMVINPEQAAAAEIARVLRFPSAMKIDTFAKGRVELLKFKLPENSPLVGMSVRQIITTLRCDILVCTVERDDDAYIANGDFVFEEKDIISIIASPKNASDFFKKINYKLHSVKDALIMGGNEITHYLADILLESGIKVKVIEKDRSECDALCTQFPQITVINGDPIEQEILLEEGLSNAGAVLALTAFDEENILLSLFAKKESNAKIVTKLNRIDFDEVIKDLDLDTVIYPKNITSDMIVRYVRSMEGTIGSNMENLYNIIIDKIEAAEFAIQEDSDITGIPLSELKLKENVLIASILRGKKVIIPRGSDTINVGDSVIIVSKHLGLRDITDVLR